MNDFPIFGDVIQEDLNFDLLVASKKGDIDKIKELLNKGVNISVYGYVAVAAIIVAGDLEFLEELTYGNLDIHYKNDIFLQVAAIHGKTDIVKFLLSEGANLKSRFTYFINRVLENGHTETYKFLNDYQKKLKLQEKREKRLEDMILENKREIERLKSTTKSIGTKVLMVDAIGKNVSDEDNEEMLDVMWKTFMKRIK